MVNCLSTLDHNVRVDAVEQQLWYTFQCSLVWNDNRYTNTIIHSSLHIRCILKVIPLHVNLMISFRLLSLFDCLLFFFVLKECGSGWDEH